MLNVVGRVDYAASSGDTVWHRASALTKLGLATVVLLLAISTRSLTLLLALHALAWALAGTSRLPLRVIALIAAYPLLFSGLFLVATWDHTWGTPLRILLRPLTACLTAVWLIGTTPYPDLFAPLSRMLPRSVADGLFITYRALFDLIGRSERLWRALRVRGGISGSARRRLTLAGESMGTLVLYSFGRSERQYATMLLRGHTGRICGCRHYAETSRFDLWVAGAGLVALVLAATLWRMP
jgi:cobalt/nickel transport system permease protein